MSRYHVYSADVRAHVAGLPHGGRAQQAVAASVSIQHVVMFMQHA